jgi:hypothetical protein
VERFEPWYVGVADRPVITGASVTHQLGASEGDFALAAASTPNGPGWKLTMSSSLTPPGYYHLVAVDSRGVPSVARIVKVS